MGVKQLFQERLGGISILGQVALAYNFSPVLFDRVDDNLQPLPSDIADILSIVSGISAAEIKQAAPSNGPPGVTQRQTRLPRLIQVLDDVTPIKPFMVSPLHLKPAEQPIIVRTFAP